MKKRLLLFTILLTNFISFAQVSFEGDKEFGRIFDLTYHPTIQNKLYAVTMGNHIVSSNDNGNNWEVFYSHVPNYLSIERLKIIDADKMSFNLKNGIFDNNLKILSLTTNQIIQTYELPIPQDASKTWITDYAIYPQNTQIAIVSQGYSIGFSSFYRVYYTSNGGASWNNVYSSIDNNYISVNSVAISHDNPQKLFIARGIGPEENYGSLLVTSDGGQTWTETLTGIPVDPIAINPQNSNDILIGTDATANLENVYRSSDGGYTWQPITINWEDYVTDNIVHIAFNPQNPNSIVVLEENQVITTNNNFQTHTNTVFVEDPNGYYYGLNATFNPFNSNEILVSGNYHPLHSVDGGTSFSKIKNPFFVSDNVSLFKQNHIKKHLYYGVQFGYAHKNLENQQVNTYNLLPLNFSTNQSSQMLNDQNLNGRVYNYSSSFFGSNLSISNDHGVNSISVPFNHQFLISLGSQTQASTKIWVSFYEGDLNGNPGSVVYEIDFTNPDNITSETIQLPAFNIVSSIFINPNDYNIKTIALGSRIYKTIDNGVTWQNSSNGLDDVLSLTNDIIFKIVNNPLNTSQITIATSQGIFTSYDNGDSWTQISTNLVENISHSPFINGVIVATSFTRDYSEFNTYYTTNMGENWNVVANNLLFNPNVIDADFSFVANQIEIYLATSDLGVIKYNLILENLNIPDFESSNAVILYPNPTKDYLTLKTNELIAEIDIYDLSGKKVNIKRTSLDMIDVSNLSSGLYIIKINLESGKSEQIKFIKE